MIHATLHYVFDPFCGWCYAVAPLVESARAVDGLSLSLHGGGMMTGAARRPVTPALRAFVLEHDLRIAQLSGQPFGDGYRDGLLKDPSAVLDSEPPTSAILAVERTGGRGCDLLARIQRAHFVEGLKVADPSVLHALAVDVGIDASDFAAAYAALSGPATQAHIEDSRALLARVGGQGFPTFALEQNGHIGVLDFAGYLGRPREWQAEILQRLRGRHP